MPIRAEIDDEFVKLLAEKLWTIPVPYPPGATAKAKLTVIDEVPVVGATSVEVAPLDVQNEVGIKPPLE